MKVEMTIPTEQYGNVRPTLEFPEDYSTERIAEYTAMSYKAFVDAFKSGDGLSNGEWNQVVDLCLKSELKLSPDVWERMSTNQQWFLQEIKKSRNRKSM